MLSPMAFATLCFVMQRSARNLLSPILRNYLQSSLCNTATEWIALQDHMPSSNLVSASEDVSLFAEVTHC